MNDPRLCVTIGPGRYLIRIFELTQRTIAKVYVESVRRGNHVHCISDLYTEGEYIPILTNCVAVRGIETRRHTSNNDEFQAYNTYNHP